MKNNNNNHNHLMLVLVSLSRWSQLTTTHLLLENSWGELKKKIVKINLTVDIHGKCACQTVNYITPMSNPGLVCALQSCLYKFQSRTGFHWSHIEPTLLSPTCWTCWVGIASNSFDFWWEVEVNVLNVKLVTVAFPQSSLIILIFLQPENEWICCWWCGQGDSLMWC